MIVLAYCVYATLFIYRTSFQVGTTRYFSLFDDAMVSMRYAAHLATNHALVWNPTDPPVEGFTNPLFLLHMAALHYLPLPRHAVSLPVQATGALLTLIALFFVKKLADISSPASPHVSVAAVFLVAFHAPSINWALQGTEVSLMLLAVTVSTYLSLRYLRTSDGWLSLCAVLAASTLIRPDALVFASLVLVYLGWAEPRKVRLHLLGGGLVLAVAVLAQFALRWHYFGDMLPNTYYLKLTGYPLLPRISRGIAVTIVFLALLTPVLAMAASARRCEAFRLAFLLFTGQLLYNIYVGGDAWEWWGGSNRYLTPVIPLILTQFASGAAAFAQRDPITSTRASLSRPRLRFIALVLVGLAITNAPQMRPFLFLTRPLQTGENAQKVVQALLVNALTDQDARIAVVWAGALPYFSERHSIDLLGKTDTRVARGRMHVPKGVIGKWLGFWPGHLKWDYDYSIGELTPDIVLELWETKPDEIPILQRNYVPANVCGFTWYVRSDSPHVRWNELASGSLCRAYTLHD